MIDLFGIGDDTDHLDKVEARLNSLTASYGELDDLIKGKT